MTRGTHAAPNHAIVRPCLPIIRTICRRPTANSRTFGTRKVRVSRMPGKHRKICARHSLTLEKDVVPVVRGLEKANPACESPKALVHAAVLPRLDALSSVDPTVADFVREL